MSEGDPPFISKMLQEFKPSSKMTPRLHYRGSNRLSGAFPLPSEVMCTPSVLGPKEPFKRPFDETILNENDAIIKKRSDKKRCFDESFEYDEGSCSDSSIPASPWETRRIKSELIEARAEILTLESRISQLHGLRKETDLLFQQEKASLKQTIDRDRNTIVKLENRLKVVKKREEKIKEEMESSIEKFIKDKQTIEAKVQEVEMENLDLKKRLSETEEKYAEARREVNSLTTELAGVKSEAAAAKEQVESLNASLVALKRVARQAEVDRVSLTTAQIKISEMESELKNLSETSALVKAQQNKLMRYSELERQLTSLSQENNKLRQSTSNSVYLEGVVEDLRCKLSSLADREAEVKSLRVELGVAEGKLGDWVGVATTALGGSTPEHGPSALAKYLRTLHSDHLVAKASVSHLQLKIKTLEENHQAMTTTCDSLKAEIAKLKNELDTTQTTVKRLKKQNTLVMWERNDLRSLLDSCQKEVTMHCMNPGVDPRTEVLEKLVENYRARLEELEANPDLINSQPQQGGSSPGNSNVASAVAAAVAAANKEAEAKLSALTKERDQLSARIEQLEGEMEHRALKGDFNLRDTKIVHFRMNPLAESLNKRADDLEAAQEEVAKLKERIRLMEQGQTNDLTQVVEANVQQASTKQIEELEEKLKSQETQNQRLREVFKAKGHEFREAIFSLLGYKVDSLPNKVYRLASLYAESPDHHLIFKMSPNGDMELLETEFSTTVSDLIDLHLCQHHSIPVFLSTITIDLFNRQTLVPF